MWTSQGTGILGSGTRHIGKGGNMEKKETVASMAVKYLDQLKVGDRFHGSDVIEWIGIRCPELANKYPDTALRKLRMYRRDWFKVVDYTKGMYVKVDPSKELSA